MRNKQMEMMAQEHDVSAFDGASARILAETAVEAAAGGAVSGYQKIEDTVVGGYKTIKNGVVEGFRRVTDKCVEALFAREGESVEDAKNRLAGKEDT